MKQHRFEEVITGKQARKEGRYGGGIFVLERPEKEYDYGLWLIPSDGGYALWFTDSLAMANYIAEDMIL